MGYPIQVVARKTGLSQSTLRAWERRYAGIRPDRDPNGRRVYSEELTEKLTLLASLVDAGYRIGQIASQSLEDLRAISQDLESTTSPQQQQQPVSTDAAIRNAADAVTVLDDRSLYHVLEETIRDYGRLDLIDGFIFPLVHEVERRVEAGSCLDMHLTFLKCTLRTVVSQLLITTRQDGERNVALIASPASHVEDLGLVASAVHAHAAGWRPLLLGAGIRSEEIAEAVTQAHVDAVILGVGSKRYDLTLMNEMVRVRRDTPSATPVYFGGRLPARLVEDLKAAGLMYLHDMGELRDALSEFADTT